MTIVLTRGLFWQKTTLSDASGRYDFDPAETDLGDGAQTLKVEANAPGYQFYEATSLARQGQCVTHNIFIVPLS